MIALCNPCARAQLHQQKRARKLCSATLIPELNLQYTSSVFVISFLLEITSTNIVRQRYLQMLCRKKDNSLKNEFFRWLMHPITN